jgi:hypothetical protein
MTHSYPFAEAAIFLVIIKSFHKRHVWDRRSAPNSERCPRIGRPSPYNLFPPYEAIEKDVQIQRSVMGERGDITVGTVDREGTSRRLPTDEEFPLAAPAL